jgi:hypothetical protein
MTKSSVVWNYAKNGKCQVQVKGKICGESVRTSNTGNVWRDFERFHKEFYNQLKAKEENEQLIQPKNRYFCESKFELI